MVNQLWRVKERACKRNCSLISDEISEQEINNIVNELLATSTTLFSAFTTTNANAVLFIRDMVVYIEFCAAIKAGDVGRIEEIIKWITIMFQAGNHKDYGFELLRFRSTSMTQDIRHILRSLEEHDILNGDLCPTRHQEHPFTETPVMDLVAEGSIKLVHGGYSKFVKRMEEEKLGDALVMDRNLEELMKEFDEETDQASNYLERAFK
ncbi:hypothetical protein EDD11_006357 [Mortierella claussenii]|nr:hypothetical protein EDD11_006357 [Mortierella claussenii]